MTYATILVHCHFVAAQLLRAWKERRSIVVSPPKVVLLSTFQQNRANSDWKTPNRNTHNTPTYHHVSQHETLTQMTS